jgi:hypothetical protein
MWDFWWTKYGLFPRTYDFPLSLSYHDFLQAHSTSVLLKEEEEVGRA